MFLFVALLQRAQTLQLCHYTCLQCLGPANYECMSCPKGRIIERYTSYQLCVCAEKYFDGGFPNCQKCMHQCKTCRSQFSCDECPSGKTNRVTYGNCPCIMGYYDVGKEQCQPCPKACSACTGINYCIACHDRKITLRFLRGGHCICLNGYYDQGEKCERCHPDCHSCDGPLKTDCFSCASDNNRVLSKTQCLCSSHGYYDEENGRCGLCHATCLSCFNKSPNSCSACSSDLNRILVNYICKCKAGYQPKEYSDQCIECFDECTVCKAEDYCVCDEQCQRVLNYQTPLTETLKSQYNRGAYQMGAYNVLITLLQPFGFFTFISNSPQLLSLPLYLDTNQSSLMHHTLRFIVIFYIPVQIAEDQYSSKNTTIIDFWGLNLTEFAFDSEDDGRMRLLGISKYPIVSTSVKVSLLFIITLIVELLRLGGNQTKHKNFCFIADQLRYSILNSGMVWILISFLMSLRYMIEIRYQSLPLHIFSILQSVLFLSFGAYKTYQHYKILRTSKEQQARSKIFDLVKIINFGSLSKKLYPLFSQLRKYMMCFFVVFLFQYPAATYIVLICLQTFQLISLLIIRPYNEYFVNIFDGALQFMFIGYFFSQTLIQLQSKEGVFSATSSSQCFYTTIVIISFDAVRNVILIIKLIYHHVKTYPVWKNRHEEFIPTDHTMRWGEDDLSFDRSGYDSRKME